MQVAEIIVTREALDSLVRTGEMPDDPRYYTERSDGRFNLRVGRELRSKLDSLVVRTGLSHSEIIIRLELLTGAERATDEG